MATDRDERQRQRRELEEIRRSFAEMGARMGSLFEPGEPDEPERAPQLTLPAPAAASAPARPRWWWATALVLLLFLAGTAFGLVLPWGGNGGDGSGEQPTAATTATTQPTTTRAAAVPAPKPKVSVPEACVETAELADEVISHLNRNDRDERLFLALRDYTIASQACRKEASP
jgi:hypothetical protein